MPDPNEPRGYTNTGDEAHQSSSEIYSYLRESRPLSNQPVPSFPSTSPLSAQPSPALPPPAPPPALQQLQQPPGRQQELELRQDSPQPGRSLAPMRQPVPQPASGQPQFGDPLPQRPSAGPSSRPSFPPESEHEFRSFPTLPEYGGGRPHRHSYPVLGPRAGSSALHARTGSGVTPMVDAETPAQQQQPYLPFMPREYDSQLVAPVGVYSDVRTMHPGYSAPTFYGSPVPYDPRFYRSNVPHGMMHYQPVAPAPQSQIQKPPSSRVRRSRHRRQSSRPGSVSRIIKRVEEYPSLRGRLVLHRGSPGQQPPEGWQQTGKLATLAWEDEGTLCLVVEVNGIEIARRCDNNMINGTKLLNYAGYTRGRRDGVLKHEQVRHVVKVGSMNLKGVWIPFERAMEMVQREGLLDNLYPLFVADLETFLYHPQNLTRTLQVVRAAEIKNPVFRLWRESIPYRGGSAQRTEETTSQSGSGESDPEYYYG